MFERLRTWVSTKSRGDKQARTSTGLIPYRGQSTSELLALVPTHRTDMVVTAFVDGLFAKQNTVGLEHLSSAERVVLAVEAIERDINSDGFDGLFRWSADLAPHFISSLSAIGREDVAEIVSSAIDALKINGEMTAAAVGAAMSWESRARDSELEVLDQRYYALDVDMAPDVLRWIEANRSNVLAGA